MKPFLAAAFALLVASPALAEMQIQQIDTPGGFHAWLAQEDSIPFTSLEIRFRGGTSLDAPGKEGAINLMTGLLEEGSGEMDSAAFAEASESLAASYRYRTSTDSIAVSAQFLTENRDEAVDLLRQSLIEPRFDDDAIERVRQQVLSGIASDAKDPDAIASHAFDSLVFGDHPYARASDGTIDSVTALTRADLIAAHQAAMTRDRVYISAAGDISADELSALIDNLLADLPESGVALPPDMQVATTAGVTVVPFETPQSVAIFGHEGITRDDPDFFAAYVLNTILGGGGFEARLMNEVREKRGLTYGVYSYLMPMDHAELYVGRVASANDRIAEAVSVIRDEWAKMVQSGVTQEELTQAQTYLTGAYPLRFDGNGPIARILVGMQMDGLTPDYVLTRNDKIEALTLDEVNRVASRILKPEALRFVVIGQPEGLEETPG
ncbi:pitrilysin family protein [Salipiger sp. 1_MG-2023]|uniref:M16 family metallopeptidase n=1 Tax=Salipiger sp. 1_MG-2023 TaxID=3062665 RepID=UPI0026E2BDF5|nr:pitrilysin family protein [Salipiger sp. 1_MG-2023]MDO6586575.1 pitrilysin family protein [Salipiger sp. 1_MG-2023]